MQNASDAPQEADEERLKAIEARREQFIQAMDDDLNTADALSAIFELVRDVNSYTNGAEIASKKVLEAAANMFDELTGVLGIVYNRQKQSLEAEVGELIQKRQQARKDKDFKTADAIRDELKARGIVLEDTPRA